MKEHRYEFMIEYRWGRHIIITAVDKDSAIKKAKLKLGNEWDYLGKIHQSGHTIEGDSEESDKDWLLKFRNKMENRL